MNTQRRVVLVTRRSRLAELVSKHNTLAQAQFYVEHLGADFDDYINEDRIYTQALNDVLSTLQQWGRYQNIDRLLLPNFIFAEDDIVVTLGQDGLVANTLKYLTGQPVIGINPDSARWDGILLAFEAAHLKNLLPQVAKDKRASKSVTLAQATLSDGQSLCAVNDLFIGTRTHYSARYELSHDGASENQSSSGVIVSTGLGSTAWMKSIVTGAAAIASTFGSESQTDYQPLEWDAKSLIYAVREPFTSQHSSANHVFGTIEHGSSLILRSHMAEGGVIFSDGMESDFLRFEAGIEAKIAIADVQGFLVQ